VCTSGSWSFNSLPQLALTMLPEFTVMPLPQTSDEAERLLREFQTGRLKVSALKA
jgi:hypothetical protein